MKNMRQLNPRISVIMPTYNVEEYVAEAISSILDQTFTHFEFIIIDDGSTDKTLEIIKAFKDSRIRLFQKLHLGTVYQLNHGLGEARGEFIARQDSDDYSHPERFENQVNFLDFHPEYAVVSSNMALVNRKKEPIDILRYPREPDYQKLMRKCCISHAASMWRKEINDTIGGYDEQFNKNCCEDYDFWLRVVEGYKIYVIDDVLYTKREHAESSISLTRWTYVPIFDELARRKAVMREAIRDISA
jgi:glycosyltransferase involved in cell wall biosynthesis